MSTKGCIDPSPPGNRRRQWLWFMGLALAGMAAMLVVGGLVRLILWAFA